MAIQASSADSTTAPAPQPLTFPAQTFAKLSPSAYLTAHLTSPRGPLRPSGRQPSEARPPTVHTGSLTHTHGSAVVRCGDTAVVCGVRGEILRVEDIADWNTIRKIAAQSNDVKEGGSGEERADVEEEEEEEEKTQRQRRRDADEISRLNLLVPNLTLETGCSPSHLPSGPPSALAQTLTHRILTLLHTSQLLDLDDLRIWTQPLSPTPSADAEPVPEAQNERNGREEVAKSEIKAFWTLYIDILFISLAGNPFDAAWFALLAALQDVRLPRAWYDADAEKVLCSPVLAESRRLQLYDVPVALSFCVFWGEGEGGKGRKWVLVDPDGFEEGLCREGGCVVVGEGGRVVKVEVGGVEGREVRSLVGEAGRRRSEWLGVLGGGVG